MGFGDVVQQAIHAGTGVPRLYAAATRAGLGPSGAFEVLRISQAALQAAATHGRGVTGRTNAMRHFMWQATLTARFGLDAARAIAAAQEAGTPSRRDSRADEHNNAAGQAYGSEHAEDLAELTPSEAMTSLVPVALAMWESGELVWVSPRP
jgi:predicted lipid-binding transport protein (Tim44 family)